MRKFKGDARRTDTGSNLLVFSFSTGGCKRLSVTRLRNSLSHFPTLA